MFAKLTQVNDLTMKMKDDKTTALENDAMKDHYDFDYSKAKPNRFAERINEESVMVVLDPDVAAVFPTTDSVNETLRVLAKALENLPTEGLEQDRTSYMPSQPAEA